MTENINEPLLEIAHAAGIHSIPAEQINSDTLEIPKFSMKSLILMEMIDSPFARQSAPKINPVTGVPEVDENGQIVLAETIPTIEEVMKTFYVLINSDHPDIVSIIKDPIQLEMASLQMADGIPISEIKKISGKIQEKILSLNSESSESGAPTMDSGPKDCTGPTST